MADDAIRAVTGNFSRMREGDLSVVELFGVAERRIRSLTYFICAHSA